jgi:lysine 2,3-aminomutase
MYRENITRYLNNVIINSKFDNRLTNQFFYNENLEENDKINIITDVSKDREINLIKGLYHRYPSKVLIFPTERCLGSCRFCFRKNIIDSSDLSINEFNSVLAYIKEHDKINEVIFSGGDPFAINIDLLLSMIMEVSKLESVKIIRIHTRVLTYCPELITEYFINKLKSINKTLFMVFHINSHLELTEYAIEKVNRLTNSGILCFSQTALLKGVNDNVIDLKKLFENLIENKIKPYYLFHPDRVKGTGHFYIPLKKGIELYNNLYNYISGLAMPIYLFNIPNGYGHCIVDLGNINLIENNTYKIHTWDNNELIYNDISYE